MIKIRGNIRCIFALLFRCLKRVYVLCPYVNPSKKAGPPNAYN
jgi:hypothetical protein